MRLKSGIMITVLLAAGPVWAHHGSGGFDQKRPVHFIGKVSLLEWGNPHVVVHIEVAGTDGKVATWLVNTLPPNAAKRLGFPESSFAMGTEISVDGYQATDGSNHVNGTSIVFKDGRKISTLDCFADGARCFTPAAGNGDRVK